MPIKTITVLAGETIHPTTRQFQWLAQRPPAEHAYRLLEGPQAFEQLDDADLLIVAGLYWTGSSKVRLDRNPVPYMPPSDAQKEGLRRYVASGRPVLSFHGGIASFDDWPDFGRLLGYAWHWDITKHGPIKSYRVYPKDTGHPVIEGIQEFHTTDENYFNVQLNLGTAYRTHLFMDCGDVQLPMLITCEGGHCPGAGRSAYLALGHDMAAIQQDPFLAVFDNTLRWLLQ